MSREFRFVHAADVHLDTPYRSRDPELRRRLAEAGRSAFQALVDLAIGERADALVIAGDLFDNQFLTVGTELLLVETLERATQASLTVVASTGNHDPGRAGYRAHDMAWPMERFHLIREHAAVKVPVKVGEDVVGWIVGTGHQTDHEGTNLAAALPSAPGPEPAVAVVHAAVESAAAAESHDRYAPCTIRDLAGKGYAYWALGHVHVRQQVQDDPPAWYPGNLQGRHFGETGAKGALLVTLKNGQAPCVEFRPLAPVRWERVILDGLVDVHTAAEVVQRVARSFTPLAEAPDALPSQAWMLRFELAGPCPLVAQLRDPENLAELGAQLRDELGVLYVEVRDTGLHRPIALDEHRGRPHLLGLALEVVDQARSDEAVLNRIGRLGLAHPRAAEGSDVRRAYLRDLLADLDLAAAEALLREAPG
ncbi:MAG: DNA repair exonuclease [Actinobacteria bacterium]|nr:DNA repair exonuclease [Actinomycetota bacterium]